MKFYVWPAGQIQNKLTEICAFKICFQLFSATLPHQSVLQRTFYLMILAKYSFFEENLINLLKKLPKPVLG